MYTCIYSYTKACTHSSAHAPTHAHTNTCTDTHTSPSSSPTPQPRGSMEHHRRLHNQVAPFFSVLHRPLGPGQLQACPFSDVVFSPVLLSALSSSPLDCALRDGFGQVIRIFRFFKVKLKSCAFWLADSFQTKMEGHHQQVFSSLINPLTARVVGEPQMISQPVFSIVPCSPLPSGSWQSPCLSIP